VNLKWEAGLHAAAGARVENSAYERYVGRWSRLFVPAVLAAAKIGEGDRVLDVASGTGEAAHMAIGLVGSSGLVIGADISCAMLAAAHARLSGQPFCAAAMDGQALAFRDASFDAVLCQLGLMFFPDPLRGLAEFRRVLRPGRRAAACVISTPDRAPMWGFLAEALSRRLPDHATTLHLSFALADPARLESLFQSAGFRDVAVTEETREAIVESFDEYWGPIEAGAGQLPQAYLALPERDRQAVRDEVRARLSAFESAGRYRMSAAMIVGAGRA
jgi:ubiquinone/menaquinone biosynthesis C-methylase UbiE